MSQLEAMGSVCISLAYAWLAELLCFEKLTSAATRYVDKAVANLHLGIVVAEIVAYRVKAVLGTMEAVIDWQSVNSDMGRSLALAQTHGYRPDLAVSHFRYAELLRVKGELDRARGQLNSAMELFDEMGMTWWARQAIKLGAELELTA
jgi:hypothetical protein